MSQSLVVRIGGDISDLQKTLKGVDANFNKVGDSLIGLGKTMGKAITAPLVGIAAASIASATTFEKSMSKVATTVDDAADNMEKLGEIARESGRTSIFSANQVAEAMSAKGLAGMTTADIYASMADTINLATSANMDLATATEMMTNVMGIFGKEGEQASLIADMMTSANKTTALSIADIEHTMKNAGSAIAAYGISLEDATLMTVLMGDASLSGAKAGTAMRAMFDDLAQGAVENAAEFRKLGIQIYDSNGNMLPAIDIVNNLREGFDGMSDRQRVAAMEMLGMSVTGQKALLPMLDATDERIEYLTGRFDDVSGSAEKYANIMKDNVIAQGKILKNNFIDIGIEIGNVFLPILADLIGKGLDVARMLGNNLTPEMAESIVKWGALVAAIGPALIITGKAIKIFGQLKVGFVAVKGGAKLTTVAMSKGLTPAIGALMAKTMLLSKKAMIPLTTQFTKMTGIAIKPLIIQVKALAAAKVGLLKAALVPLAIKLGKVILVIGSVTAAGVALAALFGGDLSSAIDRFGETFPRAAEVARAAVDRIRSFWEGLRNFLRNPIRGIVNIFQRNNDAGQNANGTRNWEGGLTWVHERGAELINLPSGTEIIPHSLSRLMAMEEGRQRARMNVSQSMVSGSGIPPVETFDAASPITNNFNISSIVIREEADIQRISKELYNLQNQRNRSQGVMQFA